MARPAEGFKVFVGGLDINTTDETLYNHFSQFGDIKDHIVMKGPDGKSRCFGFVTFESESAAEAVVSAKHHNLDGKEVETKSAIPGAKQLGYTPDQQDAAAVIKPKKIFIGGLHADVTTEMLRDYFSQFGEISDCISMNDGPTKRGFGYVEYTDQTPVEKVMETPLTHELNGKAVECKRCVPKTDMKGGKGKGKDPWKGFKGLDKGFKGVGPYSMYGGGKGPAMMDPQQSYGYSPQQYGGYGGYGQQAIADAGGYSAYGAAASYAAGTSYQARTTQYSYQQQYARPY